MRIVPDVGSISRLIILSDVVLPQPDGPTKATISPAGIVSESDSTAGVFCPGYFLTTFSSRSSAPLMLPAAAWSVCVMRGFPSRW